MDRRSVAIWAATISIVAMPVRAQSLPGAGALGASLAAYMRPYVEMRDFSGHILVAIGDSVIVNAAFVAPGEHASNDTRYAIGSLTKTFTAAAISVLEAQGKLKRTDTLGRFIPEYTAGRGVTIEQLLTHTAGVPDYYTQPDYPAMRSHAMSISSLATWLGTKPLDFTPGTKSNYSNSGFALLAGVIERASGRPYATFIDDALLKPAGMHATGQLAAVHGPLAAGHNPGPAPSLLQTPTAMDLSWLMGNGSMYSTTDDLLRWVHALTADQLFAFTKLGYPYGWHRGVANGDTVIDQTARIPIGYASQLTVIPARHITIVVLNAVQTETPQRISNDILAMLFGRAYSPPAIRPRVALADSIVRHYAGRFEIAPGFVLTVRATPAGLELAGPEGDFFPLDAVTETSFFYRTLYARIGFVKDSTGWNGLSWDGALAAKRVR